MRCPVEKRPDILSVDPCFNFLFFQQDRHTVVVGSHAAVGRSCQDREAVLIAEAG